MRTVAAALVLVFVLVPAGTVGAQDVPLEYRVKAAFLLNFFRFVEWPAEAISDPLTICVAAPNPFAGTLAETIRGEQVAGRTVEARVIVQPDDNCHIVFVPNGAATAVYLDAAKMRPMLTVGESPDFLAMGGMINFVREGPNVRFEIDQTAAERSGLRISSRLLQLARLPERS